VPVLAFAGGADPQDPASNLADLERHFPDSRIVVFPHLGHDWAGVGGCLDAIVTDFVDSATTKGLDTTFCADAVVVPPFPLTD
jgi:pimeloyl-ACP methyl ester carboxylesterase